MVTIEYKLDVFEGPMDLLLQMIGKKKVSINDVPILEIIEQYLDFIKTMQQEDLDVSSEFLEMAARLLYIKTLSLLPVHEEETELLVEELRGELTEYADCKRVAEELRNKTDGFDYFCKEPEEIEMDMTYTRIHEPVDIFKAYIAAVGKGKRKLPPSFESFRGIVSHKIVSVTSRVVFIVDMLKNKNKLNFGCFFDNAESKSEMVATFLAMLSMAKAKRIRIDGDIDNQQVTLISGRTEGIEIDE